MSSRRDTRFQRRAGAIALGAGSKTSEQEGSLEVVKFIAVGLGDKPPTGPLENHIEEPKVSISTDQGRGHDRIAHGPEEMDIVCGERGRVTIFGESLVERYRYLQCLGPIDRIGASHG